MNHLFSAQIKKADSLPSCKNINKKVAEAAIKQHPANGRNMTATEVLVMEKQEHEQKAFFEQESPLNREILDTANEERLTLRALPGITEKVVRMISKDKNEPAWMLQLRLKALEVFQKMPIPTWGPNLDKLKLNEITYFAKPNAKETNNWEEVPEDIRRTFERLGIPEAERTVLAGAGSQYDCLTSDSLVYTNPKGPVKIKNLKVGDTVFAWDEKTNKIVVSKVKAVLNKGDRPVFKVKVAGREIKVTTNHPFLALVDKRKEGRKRARYAKEWKYLSDLKGGDVIAIATDIPDCGKSYKLPEIEVKRIVKGRNQFGNISDMDISKSYNEIMLPKATNEDLMWFLGLFLGDGYIGYFKEKDKANVKIAIPESQPQLRKELIEICKRLFDYDLKSLYKDYVCINSTILARFLEKIGFSGNAKTKKIPDWVLTLPKNEKLAFLGGYLDSDGNVRDHKKSKEVVFTSINQNILLKAKQLCTYCGLQTSKITTFSSKHPFDKTREMTGHRLHVSGNTSLLKSRYDFKRDRLFKKKYYAKFSSILETDLSSHCRDSLGFAKIKSIDYAGIEQVYDISVEKYKNFVAEGIIVHNSEMVYHNLKEEWTKQGVIFENMDVALQNYPELVREYFMKCVPITDHKFAALHGAVWSGGTFIYIPKGVKMQLPLQAYFRMNAKGAGQFEHTLIIVDEGAEVMYIEGCSAPVYNANSLHAGCVEVFVKKGARARYSSVENWSKNTYNLNTKRALVEEEGIMEWIGSNMGSCCTMLYPCSILKGKRARADHISIAFAGKGQNQDTGAKVIHLAEETSSTIKAKSISKDGGITTYRGLLKMNKGAKNAKSHTVCDALILDKDSISNTTPYMEINGESVDIAHEATTGRISEEKLFYLRSRGLSEENAMKLVVSGFIEPIVKQLPLEYAVELNRLIELELEGVG